MLIPSAKDENRKGELKRMKDDPKDWGPAKRFTGNRGQYRPNTK